MRNFECLLVLIGICCNFVYAQGSKPVMPTNPLDCAAFLLRKENNYQNRRILIAELAERFKDSNQIDKAIDFLDLLGDNEREAEILAIWANKLRKQNRLEEAEALSLRAFRAFREENDFGSLYKDKEVVDVIESLVAAKHDAEVLEAVKENNEDIDNTYFLIAVANGYLKNGDNDKALELVPQILRYAQNTEWQDLKLLAKAKSGTIYLKTGKTKEAEGLYQEVIKLSPTIKDVENIFKDDLWEEIYHGYKATKRLDKAIETLFGYKQTNLLNAQSFSDRNLIDTYLENNQKEKAFNLLRQITAEGEDFDLNWAAEIYLKIGDAEAAKNLFLSADDVFYKKEIASEIADFYFQRGKKDFAVNALNAALSEVKKIKTDEPENGLMATTPAREKAEYSSDIASKFIELNEFETALNIIQTIEKPFIKAKMLAFWAEKRNAKDSLKTLNQALEIVRKTEKSDFDANKLDVWGNVAAAFAKIGDKNKAAEIFAEILSKQIGIDKTGLKDDLLVKLGLIGFYYESAGLKNEDRIDNALRKIIKNWEEDKYN